MAFRSSLPAPAVRSAFLGDQSAFAIVNDVGVPLSLALEIDELQVAVLQDHDLVLVPPSRVNRMAFEADEMFWTRWLSGPESAPEDCLAVCAANILPEWTLDGVGTAFLLSSVSPQETRLRAVYSCPVEGVRQSISGSESYRFSGLFGLHRCGGAVRMSFFEGDRVVGLIETEIPTEAVGGRSPEDYCEVVIGGQSPPDATSVVVEVIKTNTQSGPDSLLFFTCPRLSRGPLDEAPGPQLPLPIDLTIPVFARAESELRLAPVGSSCERNQSAAVGLIDQASGAYLATGRLRPDSGPFGVEAATLEGAVFVVRVSRIAVWLSTVAISFWVDGLPRGDRTFTLIRPGDPLRFSLPRDLLDARPHAIELKLVENGRRLVEWIGLFPDMLTAPSVLASRRALPAFLSRAPADEQRYLALKAAVGRLARADAESLGDGAVVAALRGLAATHETLSAGLADSRSDFGPLAIERPVDPRVSVIIPVHNKFPVTYNCLAALCVTGAKVSFEIVVVDDGSSDLTLNLPEIAAGVVYVRNDTALGFVGACNLGAEAARGRYLVFLNNDTEPTYGWMDELLFAFEQFADVGLVGSKLVYPDGVLQDAGGIVWGSGDPWNYGRGGNPRDPRFCYTRQADYLSGASLMIPKHLWEQVGGFSAAFAPAYFEDTDLAFKVRATGRRTVFAPHSLVYHYEGVSNGTDVAESTGLKRFQEVNRPKFKRKWREAYAANGILGQAVDLAKDRRIEGRVVFFDLDVPQPDQNAGGYANLQEIRLFQSLGYKVTFAPISMSYLGRYVEYLQRLGVEVVYSPYYIDVEQFIAERGAEFDIAYITRYQTADRVAESFRRVSNAPLLCNVADLHFLRALRRAAAAGSRLVDIKAAEQLRTVELSALSKVDLALSYSDVEADLMAANLPRRVKVGRLPWILDSASEVAPLAGRSGVAFLGGFNHAPNLTAVEYFIQAVMPLLRGRLPGLIFHIYGSHMPASLVASLGSDDVVVEGFVPSLDTIFDRCRVFVAPLTYGAGVKGKVLDSLAAGIPAVLSPSAAEALPIEHGREALIADSAEEWADAVEALYRDDVLRLRLSDAARAMVKRRFSFETARIAFAKTLALAGVASDPDRIGFVPLSSRPPMPGDA